MKYHPINTAFEHKGVELIAVRTFGCERCEFSFDDSPLTCILSESPGTRLCGSTFRKDGESIIYMRPSNYALARLKGEL